MTAAPPSPVGAPWRLQVVLLGLVTIGAFGLVLYGFGAFVTPIGDDTGWSSAAISTAFAIATLAGGVMSLGAGRLLDRIGGQPVMAASLVAGSALLLLSSIAGEAWQFVVAWGAGGAVISAGLYYSATMAITARIVDAVDRPRAYTWLTVIGGLASPIAFPLAGAFVEAWGWRAAVRAMVAFMAICTVPALIWVRGDRRVLARRAHGAHDDGRDDDGDDREGDDRDGDNGDDDGRDHGLERHPHTTASDTAAPTDRAPTLDGFGDVRSALRSPLVRRWLLASSAAMAGLVAIQVHHVGAIEATGVSLGVASTLAGIRGLLSLPGRAAAATVTGRVGIVNALRITYAVMTAGTLALVAAGSIAWVWVFVVLTGLAFGSVSPLQGLYAAELYGQRRIGTLMGMQQVVLGAASAAGPLVLGLTIDATGGYVTLLVLASALQLVAMVSYTDPSP